MQFNIRSICQLAFLLVATSDLSQGFTLTSPVRSYASSSQTLSLKMSDKDPNNEKDANLSFDDATQAIKDEEEADRMEARGMADREDEKNFEAKRDSMEEMKARIQARASDLNMEKSVATAEAIKQATQRAQAGESNTVDLSKFGEALLENPEDELTDEQRAEIDEVGQMSVIDQAINEFKNTKFPTPGATIKQAGLMVLIFVVTASIILKVDELLRIQYTDWGFIPRSGEVMDYSDLTLPEGFTDMMNDDDLSKL
jgi:hypothetical protein